MFDKTILIGHLARDPETRYTPSGVAVCNFSIAVNNGYGEKQKTCFIDITAWQKTAEAVQNYTKKGSKVLVEGIHVQDKWQEKDTGKTRTKLYISASSVKFLDSKSEYGGDDVPPPQEPTHSPAPVQQGYQQPSFSPPPMPEKQGDAVEDDIPF
jgi:single-strand DNA-binding protein